MKKYANIYLGQISQAHLSNLVNIVDETLATDIIPFKNRAFTAVDLWNVQRNRKSFIQRRNSL